MKIKTLVQLYTLVVVLAFVVIGIKVSKSREEHSTSAYQVGETPLSEVAFDKVQMIELRNATHVTTLHSDDKGVWRVSERNDYLANVESLRALLANLRDLNITQAFEAGKSFERRFGVDSESDIAELSGVRVLLKDSKGKELAHLTLGKVIEGQSQGNPMSALMGGAGASLGQYVRFPEDVDNIYVIDESLTEVKAHPKVWLSDEFLKVENIVSIQSSKVAELETVDWAISREDANGEFALSAPLQGEVNDTTVKPMKQALGYLRFNDVISTEAAEGLSSSENTKRVTLRTEQGFVYTIDFTPKDLKDSDKVLMKFALEASLGEDASDQLKKKLAFEQSLAGKIFEVSKYSVEVLLKSRSEVVKTPS